MQKEMQVHAQTETVIIVTQCVIRKKQSC